MKRTLTSYLASLALLALLSACGGGGGGGGSPSPAVNTSPDSLANICTPEGEKRWVRAHLDDVYLWYKEIVDVEPTAYSTPQQYFDALLVKSRDRFSFTMPQAEIDRYFEAGEEVGYGATFVVAANRLRVAYVEPNSPAAQQNIARGTEIVAINGAPITSMSRDAQIAALYPSKAGATNRFSVRDGGTAAARDVTLAATTIVKSPVLQSKVIDTADGKRVGYLVFTDHVATAEAPLIDAFTQFRQTGIDDLVLDLRYNGGGFLYIASEVGTMIGGSSVVQQVFEQLKFNDKHPERTNADGNKLAFPAIARDGRALPQLNLKRVFVLTGRNTCSASESIINGLSPFVQVITIGDQTCGKPYGFSQTNNCGEAYFAIQFVGVNAIGYGDYVNGFTPACSAADDLEHPLGDGGERLLSTALGYRATGACPAAAMTQSQTGRYAPAATSEMYRAPWRDNRVRQ